MRRLLPFVCVVVVVDTILYAALTPLLPHLKDTYGLSKSEVGALVAAYGIGVLVGAIPGGVVATRLGARGGVLAGLVLVTVASVGVALAGSYEALVVSRFAQGFGSSLTWASALAWLALATPRERRGAALGTAMGAAVFGALLGPVVGAAASVIGLRAAFCIVAGLAAGLAVVATRFEPSAPEPQPVRLAFAALRDREFLLGLWLMTIPALLFGALNVLGPLALDDRGFTALAIGGLWVAAAAIETGLSPWLGRVSDRYGTALPIRAALFGSCVVSIGARGDRVAAAPRAALLRGRDRVRRVLRARADDALPHRRERRPRPGDELRPDERVVGDRQRDRPGRRRRARRPDERRGALPRRRRDLLRHAAGLRTAAQGIEPIGPSPASSRREP